MTRPTLARFVLAGVFLGLVFLVAAWGKVIEGMENVDKIKRGEPVQHPDKMPH